jgi:hypothetical protein
MPRRLVRVRAEFRESLASAIAFAQRAQTARHPIADRPAFRRQHVEWACEAALLKIFVAWETYMEMVMACYATGQRAPSGYRAPRLPQRRLTMSVPQVARLFRGEQRFLGWSDPGVVIRRAKHWFRNGEPFTTHVGGVAQTVLYLKAVRNAVAHESDSAYGTFLAETRRVYGAVVGSPTPGGQLLGPCPPGIPGLAGPNLLEAAGQSLDAIALALAP